jgi:hypothetical protein
LLAAALINAAPTATVVYNASGKIQALAGLDAAPPDGQALLDYAPDLKFHWPISPYRLG